MNTPYTLKMGKLTPNNPYINYYVNRRQRRSRIRKFNNRKIYGPRDVIVRTAKFLALKFIQLFKKSN